MNAAKLLHIKKPTAQGSSRSLSGASSSASAALRASLQIPLVYVVDGKRIVGYDNERGKGDHKHIDGTEKTYRFVNPQRLIDDFMKDVKGAEHE